MSRMFKTPKLHDNLYCTKDVRLRPPHDAIGNIADESGNDYVSFAKFKASAKIY